MTDTLEKMQQARATTTLRIRLPNVVVAALRKAAAANYRDPQQQAAWILEQALLGGHQDGRSEDSDER